MPLLCRVVTSKRWLRLAVAPPDGLDDPAEQVSRSPGFIKGRSRAAIGPAHPHVRPGARGRALSLKSGYEEWVQIQILIPPLPP